VGRKKPSFEFEWIKQLAPNELQAGIESLEPQNSFWGVNLSDEGSQAQKESQQALMTLLSGRSKICAVTRLLSLLINRARET
jgi:hypothetical protein